MGEAVDVHALSETACGEAELMCALLERAIKQCLYQLALEVVDVHAALALHAVAEGELYGCVGSRIREYIHFAYGVNAERLSANSKVSECHHIKCQQTGSRNLVV